MRPIDPAPSESAVNPRLDAMVIALRDRFGAGALALASQQRDDAAGSVARTWAEIASRLAC